MCVRSQELKNTKFSDAVRYTKQVKPFGINAISQTGQPYLTYKLPRTDVLEGNRMVHFFNAEADGDVASDDVFHSNIKSIWRSVRVQVGSEDVQHVLQYGHLSVILDNLRYSTDRLAGWGAIAQGIPAFSSSGTAVRYGHELLPNGFLDNLIPLYKIPQVEVTFELNQNLAEHTDATTAVTEVNITSPSLKCTMVRSAELRGKLDGEYTVAFEDYDLYEDTSLLSGASSHTVVIPASHKSVTGIILTMRNTADINDPNWGGNKYEAAYLTNALSKLHFIIDGEQHPKESIDCSQNVELYDHLLDFAGSLCHQPGPWFQGAYDTATDGRFVLFYSFSGNPEDPNSVAGIDLNSKTGQIQVELTQLTASANTQIRGWVRYQRLVKFGSDGALVVSK